MRDRQCPGKADSRLMEHTPSRQPAAPTRAQGLTPVPPSSPRHETGYASLSYGYPATTRIGGESKMGLGSKMLTGSVLAVIGLITVKLLMGLFGIVMSFVSFVLFTVLPIALLVWLAYKIFKYLTRDSKPAYE
jgi:hypothetical protein